jgi:Zn-dependent protease
MAIISGQELIDIAILTLAMGYIFSGFIRKPRDELSIYLGHDTWNEFKYAAMIATPAVLLHEFGHKFIGLFYGFDSILHISIIGLGIGVLLKYVRSPIIFFIPAFVVSTLAVADPAKFAILAFAGPAANFGLYWLSEWALLSKKWPKYNHAWIVSKKINLILMMINMIPFGGFDGAKILAGNMSLYFGSLLIGGFLVYKNEQKWRTYAPKF